MIAVCRCLCALAHPGSARVQTCGEPPEPGLALIASATMVGNVPMPMCRFCYQARTSAQQRPSGEQR